MLILRNSSAQSEGVEHRAKAETNVVSVVAVYIAKLKLDALFRFCFFRILLNIIHCHMFCGTILRKLQVKEAFTDGILITNKMRSLNSGINVHEAINYIDKELIFSKKRYSYCGSVVFNHITDL